MRVESAFMALIIV